MRNGERCTALPPFAPIQERRVLMPETVRTAVASCPSCRETIWSDQNDNKCPRCRADLPEDITGQLSDPRRRIAAKRKRLTKVLKSKGLRYWILVAAFIMGGFFAGSWLEGWDTLVPLRYRLYEMLEQINPRPPYPQRTYVVVIGDDEYWKGKLERRVPIRRDYLAELVLKIADA